MERVEHKNDVGFLEDDCGVGKPSQGINSASGLADAPPKGRKDRGGAQETRTTGE